MTRRDTGATSAHRPAAAVHPTKLPRRQVVWASDLLGGTTGTPLTGSATGTGAATSTAAVTGTDHVGVAQASTGTTNTGAAGAVSGASSIAGGAGTHRLSMRAQLPAVPTVAEDFTARVGFIDSGTVAPVDGVWFEVDRAGDAANWRICAANNSTATKVTTAVPFDANWHTFEVVFTGAAASPTATFFIDGTQVGSINTNLPLTAARAFGIGFNIIKSAGTTAALLKLDFVAYVCDLAAPR